MPKSDFGQGWLRFGADVDRLSSISGSYLLPKSFTHPRHQEFRLRKSHDWSTKASGVSAELSQELPGTPQPAVYAAADLDTRYHSEALHNDRVQPRQYADLLWLVTRFGSSKDVLGGCVAIMNPAQPAVLHNGR